MLLINRLVGEAYTIVKTSNLHWLVRGVDIETFHRIGDTVAAISIAV